MRPFDEDFFQVSIGAAIFYPLLYFFDRSGWFAALIPAVAIHEAGHALALYRCNAKITHLKLEIIGLRMDCECLYDVRKEALCALAGPAAGLLWALILRPFPGRWADMSAQFSLGLSLFNLLPVLPMDGGRILRTLVGNERTVRFCGIAIPILLAAGAIWLQEWQGLLPAAILLMCQIKP